MSYTILYTDEIKISMKTIDPIVTIGFIIIRETKIGVEL